MKIARARILDFKCIKELELDFTDAAGRVRDVTLLVGPNASGKTATLEALDASLGTATYLWAPRPKPISPALVRYGSLRSSVVAEVRLSDDEVEAALEVSSRLVELGHWTSARLPSSTRTVTLRWTYPDPKGEHGRGRVDTNPRNAWRLLRARWGVARLLRARALDRSWFQRVGGFYLFGQERTMMDVTISQDVADLLDLESEQATTSGGYRTADPKRILQALAVQSQFPPADSSSEDRFEKVRQQYARLCPGHDIAGVVRTDHGLDVAFTGPAGPYSYEEASGGERMILNYAIMFATQSIHHSVVAIDEVELHQHPAWQTKLIHSLSDLGYDNQFILTTHSRYLRDQIPDQAIVHLGDI